MNYEIYFISKKPSVTQIRKKYENSLDYIAAVPRKCEAINILEKTNTYGPTYSSAFLDRLLNELINYL